MEASGDTAVVFGVGYIGSITTIPPSGLLWSLFITIVKVGTDDDEEWVDSAGVKSAELKLNTGFPLTSVLTPAVIDMGIGAIELVGAAVDARVTSEVTVMLAFWLC